MKQPPDLGVENFIRLETEVWRALASGDAAADERLLADEFLGVYPTGFADRSDHVSQLADGPTVDEFTLSDERLVVLSDSAVLLDRGTGRESSRQVRRIPPRSRAQTRIRGRGSMEACSTRSPTFHRE
jgi:Domain of unknown function (DUF4440)